MSLERVSALEEELTAANQEVRGATGGHDYHLYNTVYLNLVCIDGWMDNTALSLFIE